MLNNFFHIGTFAVVSIMVGKSVSMFSSANVPFEAIRNGTDGDVLMVATGPTYTATQVAATLCFVVGVMQVSTLGNIIIPNDSID